MANTATLHLDKFCPHSDPIEISDHMVVDAEKMDRRKKKRRYIKTFVRCNSHSSSPETECLLKNNEYYRIGEEIYEVEGKETTSASLEKRQHFSRKFVEEDEISLLQRYAQSGCEPQIVDVLDRSLSNSSNELTTEIATGPTIMDPFHCLNLYKDETDIKRQRVQVQTDESDDEKDSKMETDMQIVLGAIEAPAWCKMLDYQTVYSNVSYACYILQSMEKPSRTYVGITNNRFNRLRKHNGEITGGAKATRKCRPWRMIAFIDGFAQEKIAAMQFEWSMHNPGKRKLCKPWYGQQGRLHCARQLLKSSVWNQWPLRLLALPSDSVWECLADLDATNDEKCKSLIICTASSI